MCYGTLRCGVILHLEIIKGDVDRIEVESVARHDVYSDLMLSYRVRSHLHIAKCSDGSVRDCVVEYLSRCKFYLVW